MSSSPSLPPSLLARSRAPRQNGHLQTLFTQIGNFENVDHIVYERTLLRLPDGGTIGERTNRHGRPSSPPKT